VRIKEHKKKKKESSTIARPPGYAIEETESLEDDHENKSITARETTVYPATPCAVTIVVAAAATAVRTAHDLTIK
jgi:hypothetical protein